MLKNKIMAGFIAGAVICSITACVLIYNYVAPARGTIYIFNDSYPAGQQVTSDMLSPMQVDSSVIVAGKKDAISTRFVSPSDYAEVIRSGDSLRMDVSEGMPLTTSMLSVAGGTAVEMNMKSDSIAVTVAVDSNTGVTNDLKEGARVNVYSCMDAQTTLIQQNKRILAVYSDGGIITGVSIEENIKESMELIHAATYGQIYLGLVDATGYQAEEGSDPMYDPYSLETDDELTDLYKDDGSQETESLETEHAKKKKQIKNEQQETRDTGTEQAGK